MELASVLYLKCFEYYVSVIWPLLTNVSVYMKCIDLANLVTLREKTKSNLDEKVLNLPGDPALGR